MELVKLIEPSQNTKRNTKAAQSKTKNNAGIITFVEATVSNLNF